MNRVHIAAVAICALALGIGCQRVEKAIGEKIAEKALESQTGGQVQISGSGPGQTVNFKAKDKNAELAMGAGATIPDDFPKSVPIYPGSTVTLSSHQSENGKAGYAVFLSTDDSGDKVVAYYKSEMKAAANAEMNMGPSHMLVFGDDKSDVKFTVNTMPQGAKTMIQLGVQVNGAKK